MLMSSGGVWGPVRVMRATKPDVSSVLVNFFTNALENLQLGCRLSNSQHLSDLKGVTAFTGIMGWMKSLKTVALLV